MEPLPILAGLLEPWANVYDDRPWLQTAVTFVHLAGVMVGGGFALAADRATLAAVPDDGAARRRHLDALRRTHPPVLAGLGLATVSGLLLLAADVERFGESRAFWIKMLLLVLLLANGALLARAERRLHALDELAPASWRPLRAAAGRSLVLWLAVLLAGTSLLTGN